MKCDHCKADTGERDWRINIRCQLCKKFPCNICEIRYWKFVTPFRRNYHWNAFEDYQHAVSGKWERLCSKCKSRVYESFWDKVWNNLNMIIFIALFGWFITTLIN